MNKPITRIELAPGLEISPVITGLWQIADLERGGTNLNPDEAATQMHPYVEAGLTTFDMADHYGSAEIIAGRLRSKVDDPDSLQLFTKWVPKPGAVTKDDVREAIELALDRMQLPALDLLQFHAWMYHDPAWLDAIFWLDELRSEGLIKHLGLTNVDAIHLKMILDSGVSIRTNQVSFSLLDRRAVGGLSEVCESYDVKLLAYGTIAGGFFSKKWLGVKDPDVDTLPNWSLMKYKRFIDASGGWELFQDLLEVVCGVAGKHQVAPANIAARYILDQPAVAAVIVGARIGQNEHIKSTLGLLDLSLDDTDLKQIESAMKQLGPIPGDCGDEYRRPPFLTAAGDLSDHFETFPPPYDVIERGPNRDVVFSGTVWEDLAGFCRATRHGNRILVSGTTATHGNRHIGGADAASQTHFIIDKIEASLVSLGAQLSDVVRTRIFIRNMDDWEPVARAHGQRFSGIQPANTLVRAELVGDEYLVEIEAEAILPEE